MNEEILSISPSEERAIDLMQAMSDIDLEQSEQLPPDAESLEACLDIAEIQLFLQQQRHPLPLNTAEELKKFHQRQQKAPARTTLYRWLIPALTVAASLLLLWLVRVDKPQPMQQPAPIAVFRADTSAAKHPLLTTFEQDTEQGITCPTSTDAGTYLHDSKLDYRNLQATTTLYEGKNRIHRLSIPRGETFRVLLSDGTEVYLNTDSRLTYPAVFKGNRRIVKLEGEAYFNVAKDATRPFIVETGNLQVEVLGTEFDICNYGNLPARITLLTGQVAVKDTDNDELTYMQPGESLQIDQDGTRTLTQIDPEANLYWREGYFYFDNVTLAEMMQEIGRWYNIDVDIANEQLTALRLHFFANRKQGIEQVITQLNRMESIHARLENGKLLIR